MNPGSPDRETPRHMNHGTTVPPKKKMEIDIDVDLPDKMILELALMAHNRNMTLNDLCIEIIREHLDKPEECPHDNGVVKKMGGWICKDCNILVPNPCTHEEIEGDIDGSYCVECGDRVEIL